MPMFAAGSKATINGGNFASTDGGGTINQYSSGSGGPYNINDHRTFHGHEPTYNGPVFRNNGPAYNGGNNSGTINVGQGSSYNAEGRPALHDQRPQAQGQWSTDPNIGNRNDQFAHPPPQNRATTLPASLSGYPYPPGGYPVAHRGQQQFAHPAPMMQPYQQHMYPQQYEGHPVGTDGYLPYQAAPVSYDGAYGQPPPFYPGPHSGYQPHPSQGPKKQRRPTHPPSEQEDCDSPNEYEETEERRASEDEWNEYATRTAGKPKRRKPTKGLPTDQGRGRGLGPERQEFGEGDRALSSNMGKMSLESKVRSRVRESPSPRVTPSGSGRKATTNVEFKSTPRSSQKKAFVDSSDDESGSNSLL